MPAFVPIRLAEGGGLASTAMIAPMEIVLAGGRCIRLHGPVDRVALAEVVAALEGQPSTPESAQ